MIRYKQHKRAWIHRLGTYSSTAVHSFINYSTLIICSDTKMTASHIRSGMPRPEKSKLVHPALHNCLNTSFLSLKGGRTSETTQVIMLYWKHWSNIAKLVHRRVSQNSIKARPDLAKQITINIMHLRLHSPRFPQTWEFPGGWVGYQ